MLGSAASSAPARRFTRASRYASRTSPPNSRDPCTWAWRSRVEVRGAHAEECEALLENVLDAYRLARVNLRAGAEDAAGPEHRFSLTSGGRRDGTTTAAVTLALVYAQAGVRVVVVDADLRQAGLTSALGLSASGAGLRELLLSESSAEDVSFPVRAFGDRLRVVAARPDAGDAIDLLQSSRIETVVEELRSRRETSSSSTGRRSPRSRTRFRSRRRRRGRAV